MSFLLPLHKFYGLKYYYTAVFSDIFRAALWQVLAKLHTKFQRSSMPEIIFKTGSK